MFTKAGKTKMKLRVCVWFWAEGWKTCYESCRETEWQWLTGNDERKVCSAFKKQHFPKWVNYRIQIDCEKRVL